MKAIINFNDKSTGSCDLIKTELQNGFMLTLPMSEIKDKAVESIDIASDLLTASENDEGYAIIPSGNTGTLLCRFGGKNDGIHTSSGAVMNCFGFRKNGKATLAICRGCENDLRTRFVVKDG